MFDSFHRTLSLSLTLSFNLSISLSTSHLIPLAVSSTVYTRHTMHTKRAHFACYWNFLLQHIAYNLHHHANTRCLLKTVNIERNGRWLRSFCCCCCGPNGIVLACVAVNRSIKEIPFHSQLTQVVAWSGENGHRFMVHFMEMNSHCTRTTRKMSKMYTSARSLARSFISLAPNRIQCVFWRCLLISKYT